MAERERERERYLHSGKGEWNKEKRELIAWLELTIGMNIWEEQKVHLEK